MLAKVALLLAAVAAAEEAIADVATPMTEPVTAESWLGEGGFFHRRCARSRVEWF
jgi:hypothetical protein